MGVQVNDHNGINILGQNIVDGVFKFPLKFIDPPMSIDDFKAMLKTSVDWTAAAKKGDPYAIIARDNATKLVFTTIKVKFLSYLNDKFQGDKASFEMAGVNFSADPAPVPPSDQPIISKIIRGPEAGSIKVNLVRGKNKKLKRRSKSRYYIFMFAKPDDKTGKEIGDTTDSRYLYGYDVTTDVYVWIAVRAKNSGGASLLSEKVKYFLTSE